MIAKRFDAPVETIIKMNNLDYSGILSQGSALKIPVGKFNYLRINSMVNSLPIYYRVQQGERLRTVSRFFNVSQSSIQRWNQLALPEIFAGQTLQVGWIRFDASQNLYFYPISPKISV